MPAVAEISSSVVSFPMEKRMADRARASGNPIAKRTCDATTLPTMQAEPLDAQTPSRSSAISIISESSAGRLVFKVLAIARQRHHLEPPARSARKFHAKVDP